MMHKIKIGHYYWGKYVTPYGIVNILMQPDGDITDEDLQKIAEELSKDMDKAHGLIIKST